MSNIPPPEFSKLGRGILLLSGCALLLGCGEAGWLAVRGSIASWPAVVVAGFVCWLGVVGGLAIAFLASRSGQGVNGVLGGMAIRFGLPLGVGVGLMQAKHWLADHGVFGFILVNYLTLLPIETWLSLPYATSAVRQPAARKET